MNYAIGVVVSLTVIAALVSQPGGAALAFVAGFGSIFVAVLVRMRTIAAPPTIVARAAFIAVAAMAAASLLHPFAEPFAITAYAAAVCSTFAIVLEFWRLRA